MFDINTVLQKLNPSLTILEDFRKASRAKTKNNLLYLFGALIFSGIILTALSILISTPINLLYVLLVAATVVALAIIGYQHYKNQNEYSRHYKSTVIPVLLDLIDPNLNYYPDQGIGINTFKNSELFSTDIDIYESEDMIQGYYGQTELMLSEIKATDKDRDSEGNTKETTIFDGVLLIADFHKEFNSRTFLLPDFGESNFGNIGRFFQKIGKRSGTELLQLEDSEFEKEFAAYSSNQVESRYILSTSMMRNILDLKAKFDGAKIKLAFKNSSVYIAIPSSKKFFEPDTKIQATDTTQIHTLLDELNIFLQIVDELNLNTRIWSKK